MRSRATGGKIVVIGGYGATGRPASLALADWFPGTVVVAGRDLTKACAFVRNADAGLVPLRLDVGDLNDVNRALTGASVIVMCAQVGNEEVARACLERGIHFLDVSASANVLNSIERLDDLALRHSATAVLSVGLAPGVTNLLARRCLDRLADADRVDITVQLGLGEQHGAAALHWTLATLADRTPSLGEARPARIEMPEGARTAYPFAFSDQYTLRHTLGVDAITTRLCFDSPLLTKLIFVGRRIGAFRLAKRLRVDGALSAALSRVHIGGEAFTVQVDATNRAGVTVSCAMSGHRQGDATGLVAAHVARWLYTHDAPAGVRHIEQLVDPVSFLHELASSSLPDGGRPLSAVVEVRGAASACGRVVDGPP